MVKFWWELHLMPFSWKWHLKFGSYVYLFVDTVEWGWSDYVLMLHVFILFLLYMQTVGKWYSQKLSFHCSSRMYIGCFRQSTCLAFFMNLKRMMILSLLSIHFLNDTMCSMHILSVILGLQYYVSQSKPGKCHELQSFHILHSWIQSDNLWCRHAQFNTALDKQGEWTT